MIRVAMGSDQPEFGVIGLQVNSNEVWDYVSQRLVDELEQQGCVSSSKQAGGNVELSGSTSDIFGAVTFARVCTRDQRHFVFDSIPEHVELDSLFFELSDSIFSRNCVFFGLLGGRPCLLAWGPVAHTGFDEAKKRVQAHLRQSEARVKLDITAQHRFAEWIVDVGLKSRLETDSGVFIELTQRPHPTGAHVFQQELVVEANPDGAVVPSNESVQRVAKDLKERFQGFTCTRLHSPHKAALVAGCMQALCAEQRGLADAPLRFSILTSKNDGLCSTLVWLFGRRDDVEGLKGEAAQLIGSKPTYKTLTNLAGASTRSLYDICNKFGAFVKPAADIELKRTGKFVFYALHKTTIQSVCRAIADIQTESVYFDPETLQLAEEYTNGSSKSTVPADNIAILANMFLTQQRWEEIQSQCQVAQVSVAKCDGKIKLVGPRRNIAEAQDIIVRIHGCCTSSLVQVPLLPEERDAQVRKTQLEIFTDNLDLEMKRVGSVVWREASTDVDANSTLSIELYGARDSITRVKDVLCTLEQDMKYAEETIHITFKQRGELLAEQPSRRGQVKKERMYHSFEVYNANTKIVHVAIRDSDKADIKCVVWGLFHSEVGQAAASLRDWLADSTIVQREMDSRVDDLSKKWIVKRLMASQYLDHIKAEVIKCSENKLNVIVRNKGTAGQVGIISGPVTNVKNAQKKLYVCVVLPAHCRWVLLLITVAHVLYPTAPTARRLRHTLLSLFGTTKTWWLSSLQITAFSRTPAPSQLCGTV